MDSDSDSDMDMILYIIGTLSFILYILYIFIWSVCNKNK